MRLLCINKLKQITGSYYINICNVITYKLSTKARTFCGPLCFLVIIIIAFLARASSSRFGFGLGFGFRSSGFTFQMGNSIFQLVDYIINIFNIVFLRLESIINVIFPLIE